MAFQRQSSHTVTWCVCRYLLSSRSRAFDLQMSRNLFSKSGIWDQEFNQDVRKEIEDYWKPILKNYDLENRSQITVNKSNKDKFYVLSMFPYPSGSLHMGHVRVYTISDVMARFNRLRGKEVIHPMGWDAFGLPAENAAIDRGEIPDKWTKQNISSMRKQLDSLLCSFDWNREVTTCDPNYYKWTQFIFLKMLEAGLVYRKKGEVNWDPVDQTVLADEQIGEDGLSWRSGAKVEKRNLEQWFIKTTSYSKSLLDGLEEVNADLWRDIIDNQKHWIGALAYCIQFKYKIGDEVQIEPLSVYTSTPEYIYGISHIQLTSDHPLYKQSYKENKETILGITKSNISAIHPITQEQIPVIFTNKTTDDIGALHDAHIGIPSVNDSDETIGNIIKADWNVITDKDDDGSTLINSHQLSGLTCEEARRHVLLQLQEENVLGVPTSAKLRDWLISRQRYWGTPIPIIHCKQCQIVPVDINDLPVVLPQIQELSSKGGSPLSQIEDWVNVKCPRCGGEARRETDTMDTFVDSSWYYLRYLDPNNQHLPFDKQLANTYMPVDLYIGGKEHAVLHLYFARFFNHFLNDIGMVKHREPFVDLLTQGMVMGQSYKIKSTGQYIPAEEVEVTGNTARQIATNEPVELRCEKMSKSKYNGVDPQDVLEEFGVDSTRLCIMGNVSPMSNRHWSNKEFKGIVKWQYRIWNLVGEYLTHLGKDNPVPCSKQELDQYDKEIFEKRNQAVREVSFHFKKTYLLSTAISQLQSLTNILKKCPHGVMYESYEFERSLCDLIIMISPFVPMFASEVWTALTSVARQTDHIYQWTEIVLNQKWPIVDEYYQYPLQVKFNNGDWGEIKLPVGSLNNLSTEQAKDVLYQDQPFQEYCKDKVLSDFKLIVKKDYRAEIYITSKYTEEKKLQMKKAKSMKSKSIAQNN